VGCMPAIQYVAYRLLSLAAACARAACVESELIVSQVPPSISPPPAAQVLASGWDGEKDGIYI